MAKFLEFRDYVINVDAIVFITPFGVQSDGSLTFNYFDIVMMGAAQVIHITDRHQRQRCQEGKPYDEDWIDSEYDILLEGIKELTGQL